MKDFDIEEITIESQAGEPPSIETVEYYKIIAEKSKVLANVFVFDIHDGRQIHIYWNNEFITNQISPTLLADIREIIPGYEPYRSGTTVYEYYCEIREKFDLKTGVEYQKVFDCVKK